MSNVIDINDKIFQSDMNNPLLTKEVLLRATKILREENDSLIQENERLSDVVDHLADFVIKANDDSYDIREKIGNFCEVDDPTSDQCNELWDAMVDFSLKASDDSWEAMEYVRDYYGIEDTPETEPEPVEEVRS